MKDTEEPRGDGEPLALTVDPNYSGKNLPAWFLLNTYLQKHLGLRMRFTPFEDFHACREAILRGQYDLVYANPFDWVQYREKAGFEPLVKPREHYDEVYLCVREDSDIHSLADLPERLRIASASPETLVHMVGLFLLDRAEVDRARLDFRFTGSYRSALQALLQGQASLGFIFNEVFEAASSVVRKGLRVIARSDDAFAFHAFCAGPRLLPQRETLVRVLCAMTEAEGGRRLLADLGFSGFAPVEDSEVECLTVLAQEYISGHEAIDIRATSSVAVDDSAFVVAREDPPEA